VSLSNKALVASVGLERLVGLVLWLQPTVTTADVQVSQHLVAEGGHNPAAAIEFDAAYYGLSDHGHRGSADTAACRLSVGSIDFVLVNDGAAAAELVSADVAAPRQSTAQQQQLTPCRLLRQAAAATRSLARHMPLLTAQLMRVPCRMPSQEETAA
jgi:hypothetical protein